MHMFNKLNSKGQTYKQYLNQSPTLSSSDFFPSPDKRTLNSMIINTRDSSTYRNFLKDWFRYLEYNGIIE